MNLRSTMIRLGTEYAEPRGLLPATLPDACRDVLAISYGATGGCFDGLYTHANESDPAFVAIDRIVREAEEEHLVSCSGCCEVVRTNAQRLLAQARASLEERSREPSEGRLLEPTDLQVELFGGRRRTR